jgi:hypothetical protein
MGGQSALTTRTAGCPSALALVWHHSETQQPQSGTTASCSTCTIKDYPTSYALHEGRQRPDPARPKMGPLKQRVQTHLRHLLTGDLTTGRTGVAGDRTGTHVPRRTQAGRTGLARGTELHSGRHWLRSIAPQDINGVAIADLKITKAGDIRTNRIGSGEPLAIAHQSDCPYSGHRIPTGPEPIPISGLRSYLYFYYDCGPWEDGQIWTLVNELIFRDRTSEP